MENQDTAMPLSHVKDGSSVVSKKEIEEIADAWMEWELKTRAALGDDSEMTLTEIANCTGFALRDIIEIYNTAIEKAKIAWTTSTTKN